MGIFNDDLSPNQTIDGKGDQGLKGDRGPRGLKGNQGPKGDQGLRGIKGNQGPKGDQGLKGDQGPKGDQGLRGIKGNQGPKGDQGLKGDQGPKGDQGADSSYDNTIYRRSTIGNGLNVSITNPQVKPDGSLNEGNISYYDLPSATKKQLFPCAMVLRAMTTGTTSSISIYMSDIRSDEQCHFFVQIRGTLTKPFRVLYTDNHNTAIPQFSLYEGGNNFYVLQGSFYTGLIISNPHVEIDQFSAKAGTLYIDAQFTYTDKSITSLSQTGFDVRLFSSSFDQSLKDIELNETEINDLKTRVSNIPTTQKASQSEVNDGTNNDKFITPDTFRNSDLVKSIIDPDLHEKFEVKSSFVNNQSGRTEIKQPQEFDENLSWFYPCSVVFKTTLTTNSTQIVFFPNRDKNGNLRPDRPWMENRFLCFLFQIKVEDGGAIRHPDKYSLSGGLNINYTPTKSSTNNQNYFYLTARLKTSSQVTDENTLITFFGMNTQQPVNIYYSMQFIVLPSTVNLYSKEIYDTRFYNNIIKAQQMEISRLQTELSTIKLSYDPVYYYGPCGHNNNSTAEFINSSQVSFTSGCFEITNNNTQLEFKKSGVYNITYVDGVRTTSQANLEILFGGSGLDVIPTDYSIAFPIVDTKSRWEKICKSVTVPVKKDAGMNVLLSSGDLDGGNNSKIMINRVAGFPIDII